jgi:sigma-B regulation protein RsbU (phosphoserine phosphatase)
MSNLRPRILIAEDSPEYGEPLKLMLKLAGFECLEAADGRAAVELARRERPALILMDLSLPDVDGLAATRAIRALPQLQALPIIIISGYDDAESRAAALAAGANAYCSKRADFDFLKAIIEKHLAVAT